MKDYEALDELIPKTQELHRAIFDKEYEQGFKDGANSEYEHDRKVVEAYNDGQAYILDKIKAEIEGKMNSGQWSEAVIYGMKKTIAVIDKYRGE